MVANLLEIRGRGGANPGGCSGSVRDYSSAGVWGRGRRVTGFRGRPSAARRERLGDGKGREVRWKEGEGETVSRPSPSTFFNFPGHFLTLVKVC